jgi:hypothetical protein
MKTRTREAENLEPQNRSKLIDELMDRYVDWREQCIAVDSAYERWSHGPTAERGLAFAGYRAALDLEEHASLVYADRVNRFEHAAQAAR